MSKNTRNAQFRKLDVDLSDGEPELDNELDVQGPNEGEVQALLNQGRNIDALKVALSNPPVGSKNQAVKDRAVQVVMRVLLSFKTSEIDSGIKALDAPTLDVLMKYIYRGFESPSEGSSGQLLTWHEKAFAVGGLGSIVRVLTDRKRV